MTTISVHDPAMCCSTGLYGTDVDQRLVDLAADLDWLAAQGVNVQRFGLSREPAEFAGNDTIRGIMQESEGDDLPAFLVDGDFKAKARYPGRVELASWTGIATPEPQSAGAANTSACCGGAGKTETEPASAFGCCGGARAEAEAAKGSGCC